MASLTEAWLMDGLASGRDESCVAAPNRGVNDSTIAGSPRSSSATGAEVNASVSPPPVPLLCCSSQDPALQYRSPSRPDMRKGSLMHVRAQSAHRPSRALPSEIDQQENGPRLPYVGRNQRLPRATLPRAAQQEVAGSASPEGRRPSRIPEVTGSSPEDRSTTIVRLASPLRPSFAVIAAVEVLVASSVRRSGPRFSGW